MHTVFEKKILFFVSLFCLILLFLPKLNIFTFAKETAGIRVDDIVLLVLGLFLVWAFILKNKTIIKLEFWLFSIVFFSFISFIINVFLVELGYLQVKAKIFYVVRILEYFLFFYIGCMASEFFNLNNLIKTFLTINIFVMIMQKIGLIGRLTEFGFQVVDISRVSGLASFPAEMGALLNVIFCYLLLNPKKKISLFSIKIPSVLSILFNKTRDFRLLLLFLFLISLTGARIAIVAALVIFLCHLFVEKGKNYFRLVATISIFLLLIIPITACFIVTTDALLIRSAGLLSFNNLSLITQVWDNIDLNVDLYDNIHLEMGDYDMSWWMRAHKWCYALKLYVLHPECYLLGIGPGAYSAALDGSLLRILTENGFVGIFCYGMLFLSIANLSQTMKWILAAFFINMIFFDIYLAYKPMALLFLLAGYTRVQKFNTFTSTNFKNEYKIGTGEPCLS